MGVIPGGGFVDAMMRQRFGLRLPLMLVVLSGFLTGIGVTVFVMALNALTFGYVPSLSELPEFVLTVMTILMIVTLALNFIGQSMAKSPVEIHQHKDVLPPILERLPLEKTGGSCGIVCRRSLRPGTDDKWRRTGVDAVI
ncbi:MAG: hypothetical protein ABJM43_09895 [Paracoccaceae bacterium]